MVPPDNREPDRIRCEGCGEQFAGHEAVSLVVVRGRSEWDEETRGLLLRLVIDGESVGWDEMGRMLMTYGGFQFLFEIRDRTEEV